MRVIMLQNKQQNVCGIFIMLIINEYVLIFISLIH